MRTKEYGYGGWQSKGEIRIVYIEDAGDKGVSWGSSAPASSASSLYPLITAVTSRVLKLRAQLTKEQLTGRNIRIP